MPISLQEYDSAYYIPMLCKAEFVLELAQGILERLFSGNAVHSGRATAGVLVSYKVLIQS